MKYKLEINQVQFTDLTGTDHRPVVEKQLGNSFAKAFGNGIYFSSRDISMLELGKKIYNGEVINLSMQQVDLLKQATLALFSPFIWDRVNSAIVELEE